MIYFEVSDGLGLKNGPGIFTHQRPTWGRARTHVHVPARHRYAFTCTEITRTCVAPLVLEL